MTMIPGTALDLDLEMVQGRDFDLIVDVTGASDLTGWTAKLQARLNYGDTDLLIDNTPTVDATASTVTIHIPAAETAGYDWVAGRYDCYITGAGRKPGLLRGRVTVTPQITA